MKAWTFLLAAIIATPATAQMEVIQTPVVILEGVTKDSIRFFGEHLVIPVAVALQRRPGTVITADTEAANVNFKVSDKARTDVAIEYITDREVLIKNVGRYWIDVAAIDHDAKMYDRQNIVIEVSPVIMPKPTATSPLIRRVLVPNTIGTTYQSTTGTPIRVTPQCYVDPVTGQLVCPTN